VKILAIRGSNLASLRGAFELDLRAEPLGRLGLFAIAGPVGAGKSTLLDAMCLALFHRTPRLGGRGGATLREDDALKSNDPRSLVRRGAARAHAEVDFSGRDGRVWRSRWEVRRARGQAFGRLQPATLTLTDVATGQRVGDSLSDALAAVEARLGLTFDEFCRSVLLAQGSFATFLRARPDERAALLEKITGTEIYSTLSTACFERARSEAQAVLDLERELQASPALPAADRAALEAALADAVHAEQAARTHVAALEEQVRTAERVGALDAAIQDAEAQLVRAREARDRSDAPARLAFFARLLPLRDAATHHVHARGASSAARAAATAAEAAALEAAGALARAEERRRLAHDALTARERERDALLPVLERAALLDEQLDEQVAHAPLSVLSAAVSAARAERRGAEEACSALRAERLKHEEALRSSQAALLADPAATALVPVCHALATTLERLARLATDLEGASALLATVRAGEADAAAQAQRAERAWQRACGAARAAATAQRALAQSQHARRAETSLLLEGERRALLRLERALGRDTLVEGDPCPLCGSLAHPARHAPEPAAAALEEQRRAVTALQEELLACAAGASRAEAEAAEIERALERAAADVGSGRRRGAAATAVDEIGLLLPPEGAAAALGAIVEAEDRLRDARDRREDARAQRVFLAREIEVRADEQTRLRADLAVLLAKAGESAGPRDPSALRATLLPRVEAAHRAMQAREAARRGLEESGDAWQAANAAVMRAEALEGLKARELATATAREQALRNERAGLLGGEGTAAVRTRIGAGLEAVRHDAVAAEEVWARSGERAEALDERLAAARRTLVAAVDAEALARAQLDTMAAEAGVAFDEAERANALAPDALERERATTRALDEAVNRAEAILEERRGQRASMGLAPLEPPPTRDVLVQASQAALASAERVAHHRAAIAADDANRAREEALAPRLATQRDRADAWLQLSELIGSKDGARFRGIAQEMTLDALLGHANVHLRTLAPRFSLCRAEDKGGRPDLEIFVIDRESCDERRATSSLSGGESFLVSLAMALALSALAAHRTRVESLFVDEGFSSLDAETLEAALAAFEALRSTGRQIGVISHLPALADRIGAQVRVIPQGGGQSRVEVARSAVSATG
jgi:exonuclease SbcC